MMMTWRIILLILGINDSSLSLIMGEVFVSNDLIELVNKSRNFKKLITFYLKIQSRIC